MIQEEKLFIKDSLRYIVELKEKIQRENLCADHLSILIEISDLQSELIDYFLGGISSEEEFENLWLK